MKAQIIKAILAILSDKKLGKKIFILVLSISFGFIYLLCLPVIVITSMGTAELDTGGIDAGMFTEENFLASLDSEQAAQITAMQTAGEAIETEMANLGIADQTIKAQLIYVSFFNNADNFDANFYANLFKAAPDDEVLIDSINQNYGLSIDYEDYLHNYTFVMNATINQYMFTDEGNKNCADLASWAENAYIAGWGYEAGAYGEMDQDLRYRTADNAGLILGYLNYDPKEKVFAADYDILTYTEQGDITTMPDIAGIGVYDGSRHGIYVGSGEVIYSADSPGYVTKEAVSDGAWTSWCTYESIDYPQEVQDAIESINSADDSSDESSDSGSE